MNQLPAAQKHGSFRGRIGIKREDITPPVGIYSRNWGAAEHDTADAIHRPLTLTAFTLTATSGGDPLVLVDADLGWWRRRQLFQQFRERLLKELSLDTSRLIFALSHTHASAPLMDSDSSLPGNELLGDWMEHIR